MLLITDKFDFDRMLPTWRSLKGSMKVSIGIDPKEIIKIHNDTSGKVVIYTTTVIIHNKILTRLEIPIKRLESLKNFVIEDNDGILLWQFKIPRWVYFEIGN